MNQQIQQRDGYSQLAIDLLAKAKRSGATEADIIIADGETFSVQVRLGAVDRLTKAREKHPAACLSGNALPVLHLRFLSGLLIDSSLRPVPGKGRRGRSGVRLAGGGSDGGKTPDLDLYDPPTEYGTRSNWPSGSRLLPCLRTSA
jgi:hypothetical protein